VLQPPLDSCQKRERAPRKKRGALQAWFFAGGSLLREARLLDGVEDLRRRGSGFDLPRHQRHDPRRMLALVGSLRRLERLYEVAQLGAPTKLDHRDGLVRLGLAGRECIDQLDVLNGRDRFGQLANTARSTRAADDQGVRFRLLLRQPHRRGDQHDSQG
jgi:hypothetical protein